MKQLDLDALSAPFESLRNEIKDAYKALDARWATVESKLKELPIPCNVFYVHWEHDSNGDHSCLEWRKWNGSKRICITHYSGHSEDGTGDTLPYDEWSGQLRLDMLTHVPGLFERAEEQTRDFIKRAIGHGGEK